MLPQALIHNFAYLLRGAEFTLLLSAGSIALSTAIGVGVALLHVFAAASIHLLVELYLFLARGIPLLILLFAMYYMLPYVGIDLQPTVGGILVIGIYYGAFMSQVCRAAILSVPKNQWDAARGLGMRRREASGDDGAVGHLLRMLVVVRLAFPDLLGRQGRMVAAIEGIGRGIEASEGHPFRLDLE